MPPLKKIIRYAVIGVAVIGASLTGYVYLPEFLAKQQAAKVTGTVSYNPRACGLDYPLLVEIRNGSSKVVTWVSFDIEGYRQGYSAPMYQTLYGYSSDKIISKGYTGSHCWRLPRAHSGMFGHPPENLIWKIENIDPRFDPEFQNL